MTKNRERDKPPRRKASRKQAASQRVQKGDVQPPTAPEVSPRVRMHRSELVGMTVICLVPLLAILGVFGPKVERAQARGDALGLEVRYPARYRLGMVETLEARVSNRSGAPMPRVTLAVDDAYLEGFATATSTPDFMRAYAVELTDLAPGETRLVVVDLEAERAGRYRGRATATSGATASGPRDSVALPLTTLVLP